MTTAFRWVQCRVWWVEFQCNPHMQSGYCIKRKIQQRPLQLPKGVRVPGAVSQGRRVIWQRICEPAWVHSNRSPVLGTPRILNPSFLLPAQASDVPNVAFTPFLLLWPILSAQRSILNCFSVHRVLHRRMQWPQRTSNRSCLSRIAASSNRARYVQASPWSLWIHILCTDEHEAGSY